MPVYFLIRGRKRKGVDLSGWRSEDNLEGAGGRGNQNQNILHKRKSIFNKGGVAKQISILVH